MGRHIHTIKKQTADGECQFYFRVWSTVVDAYVSPTFDDEAKLRDWLLQARLRSAEEEFDFHFSDRLERAKKFGTSFIPLGGQRRRQDDWEPERAYEPEEERGDGET